MLVILFLHCVYLNSVGFTVLTSDQKVGKVLDFKQKYDVSIVLSYMERLHVLLSSLSVCPVLVHFVTTFLKSILKYF